MSRTILILAFINILKKLYPICIEPFYKLEKYFDKGFYTSDACVGCQICKKVCPVNNITFKDNHPVWNHKCNACMACVVYCPKKAVHLNKPEEYKKSNHIVCKMLGLSDKRKRYHNPYILAKDIMKNKQNIE